MPSTTSACIPCSTIPSCSCSWLWSGTVAPGSNSITLSMAPSPNSGRPTTPAASSNSFTSGKWTNRASMRRLYDHPMSHHREEFRVEGMAEPLSHYTDAVKAGGLLFVSGIVPLDAAGRLVGEGDVAEQARQVFRNMELCLKAAGCGFDDVVKVVHYLLDVDDRPRINPVRMEFFGEARPASTLVEVSALAVPGALLEIEAVAAVPS